MKLSNHPVLISLLLAASVGAGCVDGDSSPDDDEGLGEAEAAATDGESASVRRGKKLFNKEEFDGNGRTCGTCHSGSDGTITPEEVEEAFQDDPEGPLFRSIDSDNGDGSSYTRLRENATIRVVLPLPPNLRPLDDLDATHIELFRAVPTIDNVALDPVLMSDGRAPDLETQALGAVHDHTENEREPTEVELEDIAAFQRTRFSNKALKGFAQGGAAPELPLGHTESEKRGRASFLPDGFCGSCHAGPMLNETSEFHPAGPGIRFQAALAGELFSQPNPLREWAVVDDDGEVLGVIPFPFPDPGHALTTGNWFDAANFKTQTLWGVKDTAPYFHDNSVTTLEELTEHYAILFEILGLGTMSEQRKADIVAYMKLL